MKKLYLLGTVSFLLAGCASHVIPKRTAAHTAVAAIGNTSAKTGPADLYRDPDSTPGATNPVTQTTIQDTTCKSGWTASVRPPARYTNKLKTDGITHYGFDDTNPKDYEEDHFLPLEHGGNPRDPKNLWPEPYNTQIDGQRMGAQRAAARNSHSSLKVSNVHLAPVGDYLVLRFLKGEGSGAIGFDWRLTRTVGLVGCISNPPERRPRDVNGPPLKFVVVQALFAAGWDTRITPNREDGTRTEAQHVAI